MGRKTNPRIQTFKGHAAVLMLRLIGCLPFSLNRWLATLIGHLVATLPSEARRISMINLALCYPQLSANEQRRLARQSLVESIKNTFEIALFWSRPTSGMKRINSVDGGDALQAAVDAGQPVMILAPHLGCWEVLNFWLADHYDLHVMFAPSGLPQVDELVRAGREHFGSTMYPTTARGVAGLVRAMRKGAMTAILPDQVPDRRSGRHADFYGHPAYTGTLACKLIQQTGARPFMAWANRLPGTQGFELRFRPADENIADPDLDTSLLALNRSIAALIDEGPEQYLWSYKRFRRPPAGQRAPY
ncbi:lysophospholipid acyltransferase family protein [Alcanivorax sp. DP30]|uniref:lysophospholipid acyltransferase family protein n=1 Tax=Alcanivorax sp. DP30 TaxID=2606217 RepID=UPI00136B7BCB|nr:lysophospholipid acyltransferase family protein [Alcanivorax sp. DP30]MZR61910.1 lipid A biosynthesis acyltransferase [Alcanivorax sp. DP30]